ncbi:hypothetical protein [Streptomyces sp. bgisy032]|uniref:hypothetical protein n=1 Tax=Streptomyces sp. bgisy032 TaxID=3413773 RepID=UPI003D73C870
MGDHLRLWNGKTAEILAIEEAVNQVGKKALILRLYKAGNMAVKRDTFVNMHYPE